MLKICFLEDKQNNILSLWVRPDDLYQIPFPDTDEINTLIRHWKEGLIDFGCDWEVHPAYRWALQPYEIGNIFRELELSSFEFEQN